MKNLLRSFVAATLLAFVWQAGAADEPAAKEKESKSKPAGAQRQLQALVQKINGKLSSNKRTEADLADEMKEFDKLLEEHKGEKTDDVAQILFMKAMLYLQVFDNSEKATATLEQVKKDFPDSKQAKQVETTLAMMKSQEEAKKIQKGLAVGTAFPDFDEKDVDGKPLSIGKHKGKVVLVDFWATWCGPCRAELPNVLETYKKHHDKGFEIVGISLDQSEQKLRDFTKEQGMSWQQFFDGKGWQNRVAGKYGVNSIPATYLVGPDGKIIAKDLRGEDLEKAVADALAKK